MTTDPSPLPVDVNALLHELRGREIARIPDVGAVVLSGGCPDRGYFDWFSQHYAGTIEEHVAIELFRDEPPDLPPEVRFVHGSLCDLGPLADESVDLIFAGQVVEHLPPEDLTGFLVAARRVLRPNGRLVLDSPNRDLTIPLGWHHPEHILELTPSEIRELLLLAGFDVASLTGLWLCRDPASLAMLPLEPDRSPARWPAHHRVEAAHDRPDASFIWWAEATPAGPPDPDAVAARVSELFVHHRPEYYARLVRPLAGRLVEDGGVPFVVSEQHQAGFLLIGPYIAIPPGPFSATFSLAAYQPEVLVGADPATVAARVEITAGEERAILTSREITVGELPRTGEALEVSLRIDRPGTEFGCETRVFSTGAAPIGVAAAVTVAAGVDAEADGVRRITGAPTLPSPSGLRRVRDRVRRTKAGDALAHAVRRSPTLQKLVAR